MADGPAFLGCWEGKRNADVCAQIVPQTTAEMWDRNPSHCDAILRRRVAAVSSVAELGVTIYVAFLVLRWALRAAAEGAWWLRFRGYQIVCGKGKMKVVTRSKLPHVLRLQRFEGVSRGESAVRSPSRPRGGQATAQVTTCTTPAHLYPSS